MDLGITPKVKPLVEKVRAMIREEIMPLEHEYEAEVGKGDRWTYTKRQEEIREGLKAKAKERGLWNFWLTASDKGYGLTTVEYAYLAEEMGWSRLAPETFNCSAPDTGNMEVIERYGSPAQKEMWLKPLLEAAREAALLGFDDTETAFRTFFGLVGRDVQIRLLLGDKLNLSDAEIARDARRATQQFLMLHGAGKAPAAAGNRVQHRKET